MRTYGQYKIPEDPMRCVKGLTYGGRLIFPVQCGNKRGHGPNGLYCRQHGAMEEKRREG